MLFDEALDILPLHWSGEPFSYQGRHFSADEVIARPRPVQDPIPIWVGGNSRLSQRRAAERAQGWMPMSGGTQLSSTARTPKLGTPAELASAITELRDKAAATGRTDRIDAVYSYHGDGLGHPGADADRHREALAELESAGVTWVVISSGTRTAAETFDFIESFGSTYLS